MSWKDFSAVDNTGCASREPGLDSHHPLTSVYNSTISDPSSDLCRNSMHVYMSAHELKTPKHIK